MPDKHSPSSGLISAELRLHREAVIRNVTYSTLGMLNSFAKSCDKAPPEHAGWASSVGLTLANYIRILRSDIGDTDEQVLHYGTAPGNLFTLHLALRRAGLRQHAVANAAGNARLAHALPPAQDSGDAAKAAEFWQAVAEKLAKGVQP